MNVERTVAGIFVGAGAMFLIYQGEVATGASLLGSLVGFFIGEKNGKRSNGK